MPLITRLGLLLMRRCKGRELRAHPAPPPGRSGFPEAAGSIRQEDGARTSLAKILPGRRLSEDLGLAADHLEGIRVLLEVSRTHEQPVPRAAFQNLELVSKHLREIQRQLDTGRPAAAPQGALQLR